MTRYDDPNLTAATALETLYDVSHTVQSKGYWFNEEGGWNLVPDSNGEIQVPNNAIDITAWGSNSRKTLAIRGRKVYNTETHMFDLSGIVNSDGKVCFRFIMLLPFEDLPPLAQNAISDRAVRKFAQDQEGDVNKWKFNKDDEATSFNLLEAAETTNRKQNAMSNPATATLLARMGGANGNGLGSNNFYDEFKWRQG